jgi:hypothetical protein
MLSQGPARDVCTFVTWQLKIWQPKTRQFKVWQLKAAEEKL